MEQGLTDEQLEAVLRRATELQDEARRTLDRADVVRIARELGIEARHVELALDEARRAGRRDPYVRLAWVLVGLGFFIVLLELYWRFRGLLGG